MTSSGQKIKKKRCSIAGYIRYADWKESKRMGRKVIVRRQWIQVTEWLPRKDMDWIAAQLTRIKASGDQAEVRERPDYRSTKMLAIFKVAEVRSK